MAREDFFTFHERPAKEIKGVLYKWQKLSSPQVKIVTFPPYLACFQTNARVRSWRLYSAMRGAPSALQSISRSVVNGSLLFLEPIVRASISWITLMRKRRHPDAVTQHWVAEWPKCCRFINFYSPETGDKTCFGFSTQNYVRFWYIIVKFDAGVG